MCGATIHTAHFCASTAHFQYLLLTATIQRKRIVAFAWQPWLPERAKMLRYTYTVHLLHICIGYQVAHLYKIRSNDSTKHVNS